MSGHSKWSTIKHKKAVTDARRGKLFTKLSKEIIVAAKQGGGDVDMNFRLRMAIQIAKDNNMPADNIDRAVKKGAGGSGDGDIMAEITYEGYGPKGIAVIMDCLTDNKNRTVSEIRHVLSKHGGSLGTNGCVAHLFRKVGILKLIGISEDDLLIHMDNNFYEIEDPLKELKKEIMEYQLAQNYNQFIISFDAISKPNIAGIDKDKDNSIDLFCIMSTEF